MLLHVFICRPARATAQDEPSLWAQDAVQRSRQRCVCGCHGCSRGEACGVLLWRARWRAETLCPGWIFDHHLYTSRTMLHLLTTTQTYFALQKEVSARLSSGFWALAQTKYVMGADRVSPLAFPQRMRASRFVVESGRKHAEHEFLLWWGKMYNMIQLCSHYQRRGKNLMV